MLTGSVFYVNGKMISSLAHLQPWTNISHIEKKSFPITCILAYQNQFNTIILTNVLSISRPNFPEVKVWQKEG